MPAPDMALVPPTFSLFSRISTEAPPFRAASAAESAAAPEPMTITSGGVSVLGRGESAGSDTSVRVRHNATRGNCAARDPAGFGLPCLTPVDNLCASARHWGRGYGGARAWGRGI